MILNEQQRQTGKDNFSDALKLTRRELIPALVTLPSVTAFYWGYERMKSGPVRAALIGAGGQGRSHIDSINPESIQLVAFSDIRPSQQKKARISLESKYGTDARNIELVENRFEPRKTEFDDERVTKVLGLEPKWKVPNDYAAAHRTSNAGDPLILEKSPIANVLRSMARAAAGRPVPVARKKGWGLFA